MVETTTTTTTEKKELEDPGLAYLKLPYHMGKEQEQELLEGARRRLQDLLQNDRQEEQWYSRVTYNRVAVASKKDEDNPFCITKGVTEAPVGMTIQDVQHQFDYDFRTPEVVNRLFKRIDPMNLHMTVVTDIQHTDLLDKEKGEQLRILWGSYYVAPLISNRDFCLVQHTLVTKCPVSDEQVFCSNTFSIELPDVVPDMQSTCGRVRAIAQMTGYIFRPHPVHNNQLSMAFLGQCNPRGYLPATIVNFASVSQAMNVGRVRDGYELYAQCREKMTGATYPFAGYELPRRGGSISHAVSLVAPQDSSDDNKTFYVRLRAYCDSSISAKLQSTDGPFTLNAVEKDGVGADLMEGKEVMFGGKEDPLLDVVLQVTVEEEKPDLILEFTNRHWSKTTVVLPATMEISATAIETAVNNTEETAVEAVEQ